jgi:serine/threonine-protein kinase
MNKTTATALSSLLATAATEGQIVGGHRLHRRIGNGGTGAVWEAHDLWGNRVAIKIVAPEVLEVQPEIAERVAREWEACSRIDSDRVVKVLGHGVHQDLPYLVMELVEGETLFERVKRCGPLDIGQVNEIVGQVAEALAAAHEAGVVHRDIKPGNIMLTEGGVKILDFGFAKLSQGAASLLTQQGMSLGSPTYMSPEQYLGSSEVDARTDLWALSVVSYFALTAKAPFNGLSFLDVARAVMSHSFDPVTDHRPELGADADAFYARCFAGPIVSRYQSADELAEAFARITPPASSPNVPVVSHVRQIDDSLRAELTAVSSRRGAMPASKAQLMAVAGLLMATVMTLVAIVVALAVT